MNTIPHCDSRILHAPGECSYCDQHPDLQRARRMWGIAFTGHPPVGDEIPCPADIARPPGSPSDHRRWSGNAPATEHEIVIETCVDAPESFAARFLRRLLFGWG